MDTSIIYGSNFYGIASRNFSNSFNLIYQWLSISSATAMTLCRICRVDTQNPCIISITKNSIEATFLQIYFINHIKFQVRIGTNTSIANAQHYKYQASVQPLRSHTIDRNYLCLFFYYLLNKHNVLHTARHQMSHQLVIERHQDQYNTFALCRHMETK